MCRIWLRTYVELKPDQADTKLKIQVSFPRALCSLLFKSYLTTLQTGKKKHDSTFLHCGQRNNNSTDSHNLVAASGPFERSESFSLSISKPLRAVWEQHRESQAWHLRCLQQVQPLSEAGVSAHSCFVRKWNRVREMPVGARYPHRPLISTAPVITNEKYRVFQPASEIQ